MRRTPAIEPADRLAPLPKGRRYFQDPAGNPVLLCGWEGTELLLRTDLDFRLALRRLAEHGINAVRIAVETIDRDPVRWISPFKRGKGEARTALGHRRFDLDAPNPSFWGKVASFVEKARESRIFVLLGVFTEADDPSIDPEPGWAASAWNPANHVIRSTAGGRPDPDLSGRSWDGFFDLRAAADPQLTEEQILQARQRGLLEAALDAIGAMPNVCFEIGGPIGWACGWAAVTKAATDAPVLVHAGAGGDPLADGYVFLSRDRLDNAIDRKTVFIDLTLADASRAAAGDGFAAAAARAASWYAFMNGAQRIHRSASPSVHDPVPIADDEARAVSGVRRFVRERRVQFWRMRADRDVATGRTCLIQPGERYLAYLPEGGSIALDLAETDGLFTVAWWNAKEEWLTTGGAVLGGGMRALEAPDAGEWVLDLVKRIL